MLLLALLLLTLLLLALPHCLRFRAALAGESDESVLVARLTPGSSKDAEVLIGFISFSIEKTPYLDTNYETYGRSRCMSG